MIEELETTEPCTDCNEVSEGMLAEEMLAMETEQRESDCSFLREVAIMQPREITNQTRIRVKGLAEQYGVSLPKNLQCSSCWIDTAVRVYKAIKEQYPDPVVIGEYQLREGVDVLWNGVRVNERTLTDELAAKWIAEGFPTEYFAKWK